MKTLDKLTIRLYMQGFIKARAGWMQRHRESVMFFTYPIVGLADLEFRLYNRIPANEFHAFKKGQVKSLLHVKPGMKVNIICG